MHHQTEDRKFVACLCLFQRINCFVKRHPSIRSRKSNSIGIRMHRVCVQKNDVLAPDPELFENDGIKFEIPEQIFQLSEKSVRILLLKIESGDFLCKEADHSSVPQKAATLVKKHCPHVTNLHFKAFLPMEDLMQFANIFAALLQQLAVLQRYLT